MILFLDVDPIYLWLSTLPRFCLPNALPSLVNGNLSFLARAHQPGLKEPGLGSEFGGQAETTFRAVAVHNDHRHTLGRPALGRPHAEADALSPRAFSAAQTLPIHDQPGPRHKAVGILQPLAS